MQNQWVTTEFPTKLERKSEQQKTPATAATGAGVTRNLSPEARLESYPLRAVPANDFSADAVLAFVSRELVRVLDVELNEVAYHRLAGGCR